MILDFIDDMVVFLRGIPVSGLRVFGVFFVMFALIILYSAAKGRGSLYSASPVEMAARRAQALPKLSLEKPLIAIRQEAAALLQRSYFVYGGLFLVLGALTLANLLDGLAFYIAILVISIIAVVLWSVYYKRFNPYIREINRQLRIQQQNKKGL